MSRFVSKINCSSTSLLCHQCLSFNQARKAGFQPASANLSMEVKLRLLQRKKKKIEKLAKQPLEYTPIVDFFIPYSWKEDSQKRLLSKKSEETLEAKILLEKEWARYIIKKRKNLELKMKLMLQEQHRALTELKAVNQKLYDLACMPLLDVNVTCRGPVESMPIANYLPPLGGFKHFDPPFSTDDPVIPTV